MHNLAFKNVLPEIKADFGVSVVRRADDLWLKLSHNVVRVGMVDGGGSVTDWGLGVKGARLMIGCGLSGRNFNGHVSEYVSQR